ncbi:MAG: oligosaccharide flippase family protein [Clostridia bacterium]|nr:oligosaccharide flippase family protein [Clostridia bacterium]
MNRYKKLFSDTVILGLGTFGSKLLVFLLMPFYTAWLSTDQYSTAELITSTANLLIPLACVGIANGIFRFAADRASNKAEVFSSSVFLLLCGSGVFLILSPLLLLIDYFDGYIWLILLYVLFANLQSVCAQYVRAIDSTRLFAVQGILNTLLTILFNLLLLWQFDLGVTGYVLSVILGNLITTVFLVIVAKLWRVCRFSYVRKSLIKELLWFSLPMIPTTVCWLITDLSDRYMVTYFCGSHVNGIYSAAYKIPTVINLVSSIFMQAWQFSAVAESSDEEACRSFYSQVFRGFLSVIMIGSSILVLMSRFLTGLLLNSAYFEAWRYMPTLLCAVAIESIVSFLATVYMVRKKSMHSFLTAMIGTILNLLLNFLLIPGQGALGAAIATLAAYCAVMVARLIDVRRMIPFRLCLPRLCSSVLLLLLAAGAMTYEVSGRLWWTSLCVLLTIAMNLPALWKSFRGLLQFRGKKKMQ